MERYQPLFEEKKIDNKLEEQGLNECPYCNYPLVGMMAGEETVCPNCGQVINVDAVADVEID